MYKEIHIQLWKSHLVLYAVIIICLFVLAWQGTRSRKCHCEIPDYGIEAVCKYALQENVGHL